MDTEKALELQSRARARAIRLGFFDDADDIAQEVMLSFLSGNGAHQTIGQAVIDAVRKIRGDSRHEGGRLQTCFLENGEDIERHGEESFEESSHRRWELQSLVDTLRGMDRVLICLVLFGMSHHEIGYCFGVTESRVSQRLKELSARIHKTVASTQQRECEEASSEVREKEQGSLHEMAEGISSEKVGKESGMVSGANGEMDGEEPGAGESDFEESFDEWLT